MKAWAKRMMMMMMMMMMIVSKHVGSGDEEDAMILTIC